MVFPKRKGAGNLFHQMDDEVVLDRGVYLQDGVGGEEFLLFVAKPKRKRERFVRKASPFFFSGRRGLPVDEFFPEWEEEGLKVGLWFHGKILASFPDEKETPGRFLLLGFPRTTRLLNGRGFRVIGVADVSDVSAQAQIEIGPSSVSVRHVDNAGIPTGLHVLDRFSVVVNSDVGIGCNGASA